VCFFSESFEDERFFIKCVTAFFLLIYEVRENDEKISHCKNAQMLLSAVVKMNKKEAPLKV